MLWYVAFNIAAAITFVLILIALFNPKFFGPILGNRSSRKLVSATLVPLFAALVAGAAQNIPQSVQNQQVAQPATTQQTAKAPKENQFYSVSQIIDGDTIKVDVDGKTETIRMIGLDTPETKDPRKAVQCFGAEASARAAELLKGKKVRLERDETQSDRDKYNRLLRYIYTEDGTLYNQQMIAEGYALEYTYDTPYKYQSEFRQAQIQVQSESKGLWSEQTCDGNVGVGSTPIIPKITAQESTNLEAKYYPSCDAVRREGASPLLRGQPGYSLLLDRDGDGRACE